MDVSVRRSGGLSATTILIIAVCGVVCMIAGIAIGISMATDKPEPAPGETASTPETQQPPATTPSPTPAPAAVTPPDPGTQHLEAMEDVWPARHLFIGVNGVTLDASTADLLKTIKPGGVILTQQNIQDREQAGKLIADIKKAAGLGSAVSDLPLIATDQEGGLANRLNLSSAPGARGIAKRGELPFARETAKVYAEACVRMGIGVMLAPVLDIYVPGASSTIRDRTFGNDELTVTALGLWFAQGIIDGGAIPVVKHYPGMGGVRSDARRPLPVLNQDAAELAPTMYPFIEATLVQMPGIVAGHIAVPYIDKSDPPRPAALSPTMINTVLRDKWGYGGVVIADDIAQEAVTASYSLPDAAVEALASGCDAVIVSNADLNVILEICASIESAVEEGTLAGSGLQESKKRLDNLQAYLRDPKPLSGELPKRLPEPGSVDTSEAPDLSELDPRPASGYEETIYTVQAGDVLSRIAGRYDGVSTGDLIIWNNLKDANIRVGQELVVRVPTDEAAPAEPEPQPEPAEDAPEPEPEPEPEVVEPEMTKPPRERVEYVVKSGDVLSRIAVSHDVTTKEIMEWNELQDANIRVGQTLYIGGPPPEETPETEPEESEPESAEEEPTPEPEPEPAPVEEESADTAGMSEYVVVSGDNLSKIASEFDVTTQQIMDWNDLPNTNLSVGQKLMIGGAAPEEEPVTAEPEPEEEAPAPEPEPEPEPQPAPEDESSAEAAEMTEYVVVSGDFLSKIAAKFDVTTQQIMDWNDLPNTNLSVGQKLMIGGSSPEPEPAETTPEPEPETDETEPAVDIVDAEPAPEQPESEPEEADSEPAEETPAPESAMSDATEYTVQSGDALSRIASKFDVTTQQIMEWNNLSNTNIYVGQTLKIMGGEASSVTELEDMPDESEPAPTPPPSREPEPAPQSETTDGETERKHSVQVEETLSSIAAAYGVSVTDLIAWNNLDADSRLQVGKVLTIYTDDSRERSDEEFGEYIIQSGDSPLSIANEFGITPQELMRINQITDVNTLRVGQTLRVPKR